MKSVGTVVLAIGLAVLAAPVLAQQPAPGASAGAPGAPGAGGRGGGGGGQTVDVPWNDAIPPGIEAHATRALQESSRHGEWVDIKRKEGGTVRSWVTYPERATKAPVMLVIFDIFGMRDLARAMGDQLAQDGFIAIVPDFLSDKNAPPAAAGGMNPAVSALPLPEVNAKLDAVMEYGKSLAASNGKTGVIGFCWGGARSFGYAAFQPNLNAAVVYYGEAPGSNAAGVSEDVVAGNLTSLKAPVLGLYAGNDARIGATVPVTEAAMKKLGKSYEVHTFAGSGHGFMFQQGGASGANLKAAQESWPMVLAFLRKSLQ